MIVRHFKKKPITIEAMQLDGPETVQPIVQWMNSATTGWQTDPPTIWIDTLEGRMTAEDGDWIVKGVAGEFYPCKDNIFIRTYQEV
jgi:hypothetical protein